MAVVKSVARNDTIFYHYFSKEISVLLCNLLPESPTRCAKAPE